MNQMRIPSDYIEITNNVVLHKVLHMLLFNFHKICEDNDLMYNIFGGTLLGAVRHQSIIPWDDDVDVTMPLPHYNILIQLIKSKYSQYFDIYSFPDNKRYPYPYAKFCLKDSLLIEPNRHKYSKIKVFLDIFPVCGFPSKNGRRELAKYLKYHKGLGMSIGHIKPSLIWWKRALFPLRATQFLIYRMIGHKHFLVKIARLERKYPYENATNVYCTITKDKGILSKDDYENRTLLVFGNYKVWAISNYHNHLTKLYGEYMTPPPLTEQTNKHNFRSYVEKRLLDQIMNAPEPFVLK